MTMSHHLSTNRDVSAMEALKNEVRRAFCDKHSTEEINSIVAIARYRFARHVSLQNTTNMNVVKLGKLLRSSRKVSSAIPLR